MMREIYVYGYIHSNGSGQFEGYGVYSPVHDGLGFASSAETKEALEVVVKKQLRKHPQSILINSIPRSPYHRGESVVLSSEFKKIRIYSDKDQENLFNNSDMSEVITLKIQNKDDYSEFRRLNPKELSSALTLLFMDLRFLKS
jgi:hypothetical protein